MIVVTQLFDIWMSFYNIAKTFPKFPAILTSTCWFYVIQNGQFIWNFFDECNHKPRRTNEKTIGRDGRKYTTKASNSIVCSKYPIDVFQLNGTLSRRKNWKRFFFWLVFNFHGFLHHCVVLVRILTHIHNEVIG